MAPRFTDSSGCWFLQEAEALEVLYYLLRDQRLTDVHQLVFTCSWQGYTYAQMAKECRYDANYLKFIGYELWRLLSQACGEKVTKNNLHAILATQVKQIAQLTGEQATPTSQRVVVKA